MKRNLRTLLICIFAVLSGFSAWAQPANNECAGAIATTMNSNGSCAATTAVVTTLATLSTPVLAGGGVFCAGTSGNDDVWYTFTTSAGQTGTILTFSNFVATLGTVTNAGYAVYSGTCASLTQLACVASAVTSTATVSGLTPSTTYYLRVWAGGGANSGTFDLCLQEGPPPPNCATGLTPVTGSSVALNCGAVPSNVVFNWTAPSTGPVPTGYKFYVGTGVPALAGTVAGTTATLFNLLPNTTYNWYVVPTNGSDAQGCNTPLTFTTQAEPPCAIVNNSCASATMIGAPASPGSVNSTTTGATISRVGEACLGFTGVADDDVWFKFTTDATGGDVVVALTGAAAALDAVIQGYSGSCGSLTNIGCADAGAAGGLNETMTLTGLAPGATYYVRVYGFGAFSATTPTSGTFTLTTTGTGLDGFVLPIALTDLKAKLQNQDGVITWKTLSEQNNRGFEIERSYDGQQFSTIGFVNGAGNSTSPRSYEFTDYRLRAGVTHYYRLKQIDMDGHAKNSSIVNLRLEKNGAIVAFVYPNPALHTIDVVLDKPLTGKTTINVSDAGGKLLMTSSFQSGSSRTSLYIDHLSSGIYFIRILNDEFTEQLKFIKQ